MLEFHSTKEFKNKKIKIRFKEDIEPQEILLDSYAQKKEELGFSEKKIEVPLQKRVLQGLLIFTFCLFFLLFGKTFQLQIIQGKDFSHLAEKNKFIVYSIQSERGVIYDQNGNQLVFNQPSFDLVLDIRDLPQSDFEKNKILEQVSEICAKDFAILKKEIEKSESSRILVFENLEYQPLIILEAKINSKELLGFKIEQTFARKYQDGELFSHIIGYTGKITHQEWVGRTGIEKSYEEILCKIPGKVQAERDAFGNLKDEKIISLPESGKSLILWLDSELQRKLVEELKKALEKTGSKKAVAVALDPRNGGVKALVSLPDFDNNLFQKGGDMEALKELLEDPLEIQPLFNRVIAGRYLTGSTIKPLIAASALQEKIISPEKKIYCQGKIVVEDFWNPEKTWEYEDWATHGWTDMRKAIAESCNVYFYTIGGGYGEQQGLGPTKIKEYLEFFGWGEKTGIDLPGEAKGFIPDKEWKEKVLGEGWWDGNTYYLSIGQQYIQITPLEVANAFSAIANGGILFQPQVVQKIVGEQEIEPKIIRKDFISPENLQIVRQGMRQAVTQGSASDWLNSLPVEVAAKTGTAEIGGDYYHNWVTVFAPYENPEIVLTIMVENIKEIQSVVLPVAKRVLEWYFTRQ